MNLKYSMYIRILIIMIIILDTLVGRSKNNIRSYRTHFKAGLRW